ncbi:hypothetical protein K435DRAFT_841528 [Dendrothele bispora CBS 962.96]|uniref:Uncharacterized protein n=1 Tax=Dendrothele bispora (strain CBS 962.96) TaxID=1314807 RepID=A0A4S8LM35_DENBC|nr:hypothetical protein K435DRAFT_841528 [Dendrothele bispora CBS 962.96]
MTSTPHPELHLDIVNLVIDELHDFRSDLETCALVCRSWVSQSRFHLFSTIRLSNRQRLLWQDVSSFLALCASPYSTIPLARISNLTILVDRHSEDEYQDKQLQNSAVFNQLLTWRSPHDGKSIADVFRHLKTLSFSGITWRPLSQTAKSMNLSVHVISFGDMSADCSMAVGDLMVSAGPSLESFKFCVKATARMFKRDAALDASLQHINFTENPNLREITLDVDDSAYLVPFLQRLTKSHYPPSLETLHIPRLVPKMRCTPVDYKHIDELLQHFYFSSLGEFRCRQCVRSGIEEEWYNGRPIEGSWSWKEMDTKIEELKAAMPKLADKGILQSRNAVHLSKLWVTAFAFRKNKSDEDQDTENNDENRDDREREGSEE